MRQVISAPVIMSNEVKCRVIQGILFPSLGKIHLILSSEQQKFYKVQIMIKTMFIISIIYIFMIWWHIVLAIISALVSHKCTDYVSYKPIKQ